MLVRRPIRRRSKSATTVSSRNNRWPEAVASYGNRPLRASHLTPWTVMLNRRAASMVVNHWLVGWDLGRI